MGEVLVSMEGIEKSFPGVYALTGCRFELRAGEVHALIGENGAGKSTMMSVWQDQRDRLRLWPTADGAIKGGTEAGAVTQDPIGIGYKCVEAAIKEVKGETLPKTIDTGFHWYDKTNIDDATITPLLYK